ncbi:MAG: S-layer homology domain-containing protein [Candidatus Margulisiibacteriota bacterium]|nr:S-layer homology domain-containing protein [Candidatus Margulisiibacteriota bacterium]
MGKACISGVTDATSIFTNPAGLAMNDDFNLISMSGTILSDINYIMIGASDYSPMGKFGFGYLNASVGGIPITTITGSGSTAAVVQTGVTDYSSSILFFSYGSKLSRFLRGNLDNVAFGLNLKYFLQGFSGGGATMQDAVGNGMDADLGFIWKYDNRLKFGLLFNNFVPLSSGGKFIWTKNNETEGIPMAARIGGEYIFSRQWRALFDYEQGRGSGRPSVWHTGLEYAPTSLFYLRTGIDQRAKATTTGAGVDSNPTFGVGLKYFGYTFDYAYQRVGELSDNTSHFFSIGFVGDEPVYDESGVDEDIKKRTTTTVPVPEVVPKPELKTFEDLPDGYWAKKPIEYLATLGIMGGYPDDTFRPDRQLTRGELAVILVKAKGFVVKGTSKTSFSDIRQRSWTAPYIEVAVQRGYMKGYPDDTFKPNGRVSRAETAVIFARFAGLYVKPKVGSSGFPDVKKRHWASPSLAATRSAGFFEYLSGKNFEPKAYLTRAEAAEILSKTSLVKKEIKKLISGEK